MFQNYLKTAFRMLIRHKAYTIINISGLAVGIAACLLIYTVVTYEMSYDTFQPAYKSIYHVATEDVYPDGVEYTPGIPYPALEALRTDFPQVITGALFSTFGSQVTIPDPNGKTAGQKFKGSPNLFFADPQYFEVFEYKWLTGNGNVMASPNTAVLSKAMAVKYFGDWKNAVGKIIRIDNAVDLKVSAIIDDVPANSDFPVQLAGSFITLKTNGQYGYTTDWGSTTSNFQLYMRLPKGTTPEQVNKQLVQLAPKYYKNNGAAKRTNFLRPLSSIHFDQRMGNMGDHTTSHSVLVTLSLIASLIIIMACINFINLSTAQAVNRSKEVGVRKVLGSSRMELFRQVMSETFLIVTISALAGLLLGEIALPYLDHVISIQEKLSLFNGPAFLFLAFVIVVTSLLSGIYPGLVLSGLKPIIAIKNKVSSSSIGGISLRRSLVIIQFAISQILIIGTLVAISQMDFVRSADLGFNKETVLILSSSNDKSVLERNAAFKQSLLRLHDVKSVSFSSDTPSSDDNWGSNFAFDHKPDEKFTLFIKMADEDYFKTFGLKFAAGNGFRKSDTVTEVVVNETLLKKLNIKHPQEAIGKDIRTGGGPWKKITGVVKDFKTNSLKEDVKPLMIASRAKSFQLVSVKLNTSNPGRTSREIEQLWDKFFPELAYSSSYMDETIDQFYQQETQLALLYKIFAGLAIFISCLGLYGLVSFMVVQKTKEVGIRKVVGAGIGNIVYLFSKEFTLLIILALLIAAPVAWYFMNEWLNNFAFRIHIGPGVFVSAALLSLLVGWLAVGYKAIRAAMANPVKSLRTE